jgi:hypothetical protein
MSRDPLDQLTRGFAWTTGRRAAYSLPLPLAILVVVVLSYLRSH